MSLDLTALKHAPRLLIEVPLKPVQGSRFQPTGFPDLGAATFTGFTEQDSTPVNCLLIESAQSMANRLEAVCWDEAESKLVAALKGLPYVESTLPDGTTTDSIREAHRLNSPYIVNSSEFVAIRKEIGFEENKPFNRRQLAAALFKYDPCSLLHGIFLEKVGGVVRLPRIISSFVEAEEAEVAAAGGVKFDRVQPASGENTPYGKANEGFGNVPYHRDEFTARKIVAYFNLDLAQLRGYGLGADAEALLIVLALYKIQKVLSDGLRLRTACDLEPIQGVDVKRPAAFELPTVADLEAALPQKIEACAKAFASPRITPVKFNYSKKSK